MAHEWVVWRNKTSRYCGPQHFKSKNQQPPTSGLLGCIYLAILGVPEVFERGRNQQWRTSGEFGCITPAVLGVPKVLEWGRNQQWRTNGSFGDNTSRYGGPQRFRAREKIGSGPQVELWLHSPFRPGGPQGFRVGEKISSGPQVGRLAT